MEGFSQCCFDVQLLVQVYHVSSRLTVRRPPSLFMGFNGSKYTTAGFVSSVGVHRTRFVDDVMIS